MLEAMGLAVSDPQQKPVEPVDLNSYTRRTQIKDKLVATNHEGKIGRLGDVIFATAAPNHKSTRRSKMPLYQE